MDMTTIGVEDLFGAVGHYYNARKPCLLDLGSGQGVMAIGIAMAFPRLLIVGIEHDRRLYEESLALLILAKKYGLVEIGQVLFLHGDFNDPRFIEYYKKAGIVYYADLGTYQENLLAETIRRVSVDAVLITFSQRIDIRRKHNFASGGYFNKEWRYWGEGRVLVYRRVNMDLSRRLFPLNRSF